MQRQSSSPLVDQAPRQGAAVKQTANGDSRRVSHEEAMAIKADVDYQRLVSIQPAQVNRVRKNRFKSSPVNL